MNALKEIPRQRFIEQFKYRSGTYNGDPGSFVVAKLTEDESLLFALKMDLRITKLPKSTKGRFNQTAKDMYAEWIGIHEWSPILISWDFGNITVWSVETRWNLFGNLFQFLIHKSVDKNPASVKVVARYRNRTNVCFFRKA